MHRLEVSRGAASVIICEGCCIRDLFGVAAEIVLYAIVMAPSVTQISSAPSSFHGGVGIQIVGSRVVRCDRSLLSASAAWRDQIVGRG